MSMLSGQGLGPTSDGPRKRHPVTTAIVVLLIAPEAVVHPSFQMSFAATLGLVALVQIGMPRLIASPDHSATARVALWGGREAMTLVLASLVFYAFGGWQFVPLLLLSIAFNYGVGYLLIAR